MVAMKNKKWLLASKSKHQEGHTKLEHLSGLSIFPSGKPEAKPTPIKQLTIEPSSNSQKSEPKSAKSPKINPSLASSFPKTVPRASIQKPTHPLKAKISPVALKVTRPRPGPKSKTKVLGNKPVNLPVLFTLGQLSEMKKKMRVNTETDEIATVVKNDVMHETNIKDVVTINTFDNELENSDEIMIVDEVSITETVQDKSLMGDDKSLTGDDKSLTGDDKVLSEIMKQVEDLENSIKGDLEIKKKELENERVVVKTLKGKNQELEAKINSAKLRFSKSEYEIEEKHKQIEAFKSSNEGMVQKIIKLNEENTDIDEKYKNVLEEMKEMKEKKDAEIKREKDSLKAVLQKHISNENTLKQTIKMFEKIVEEKEYNLQKEYEIVDLLKKKNEVLENSDKKNKLLLKKKESENESLKSQSKSNTHIFDKKLKQKQEDLDDQVQMYTSLKKNLDSLENQKIKLEKKMIEKDDKINSFEVQSQKSSYLMNKKVEELSEANLKLEKVSNDLKKLEEWKVTEVEIQKCYVGMIQKNKDETVIFKNQIDNLEKSVKDKDELLLMKDKKIELLDDKVIEKDKLFKDLKVKVSKLITEFSKGLKEREEKLLSKNKENSESLSKIKMIKNQLSLSKIDRKEAMKKISNFNSIIVGLSSKITKIKNEQKNEAVLTDLTEKQLQNNILELQKRDQKNSETVKELQKEICKWEKLEKLEELRASQNNNKTNDNLMKNYNVSPKLMLTYIWPIVPYESCRPRCVLIDLPLLKSLLPVMVIRVYYPPEPLLMLTYLWPVVWVKTAQKSTGNIPKPNKRKLFDQLTPSTTKRICLSYNIQPQFPLVEMIPDPSQTLKLTYQWPITKYQQSPNSDNCAQETSVHSLKKVNADFPQSRKRKLEETDFDTNKAKKIKIIQERIIKTMTINLCKDEKLREHVNKRSSIVTTRAILSATEIASPSKKPKHLMLTYLWPVIQYIPFESFIKVSESLVQEKIVVTPPFPLMKSLNPEILITIIYPSKPLLMITYLWPIVLTKRTSEPCVEEHDEISVKESVEIMPCFLLMKNLDQEIIITIKYPPQPLLMITYMWPIVLAKGTLKLQIERVDENFIQEKCQPIPHFPLLKSLDPEVTISITLPTPPLLMITYLWPIVLVKRTLKPLIEKVHESLVSESLAQEKCHSIPRFPLLKHLDQEITISIILPSPPILMITYMWPIVLVKPCIEKQSIDILIKEKVSIAPQFPLIRSLNPELIITIHYPTETILMLTYLWPIVLAKPCIENQKIEILSQENLTISPCFPLKRSLNQELIITIHYPPEPILMITYLWPIVLTKESLQYNTEDCTSGTKRKCLDLLYPSPKRIRTINRETFTPPMILNLWPLIPYNEKKVCFKRKSLYFKEENETKRIRLNEAIASEEVSLSEPTMTDPLMLTYLWPLVSSDHFKLPSMMRGKSQGSLNVKIFSGLFPMYKQFLTKALKLSTKNIQKKKALEMIGYNWPVVVFKDPHNLDNLKKTKEYKIQEILQISKHFLDFKRFTKPISSYNWPISVYKERNVIELVQSEPKMHKRKLDESNAERQLIKKPKIDISKFIKRKLEEPEVNKSIPKRIKESEEQLCGAKKDDIIEEDAINEIDRFLEDENTLTNNKENQNETTSVSRKALQNRIRKYLKK